jgi:hypothetical protein
MTSDSTKRILLVGYTIGEMQYTRLLLADVFDVKSEELEPMAYDAALTPVALITKQMMNGLADIKYVANLYLRGEDGIDIALGRLQDEMESSVKQFVIDNLSNVPE